MKGVVRIATRYTCKDCVRYDIFKDCNYLSFRIIESKRNLELVGKLLLGSVFIFFDDICAFIFHRFVFDVVIRQMIIRSVINKIRTTLEKGAPH